MRPLPKAQKFATRLVSLEKIADKMYLERFALDAPQTITFIPGQTVMLYLPSGSHRSMSIASTPDENTTILLAHDVSPNGVYAKWTLAANVGDPMSFMGPLGTFILNRESKRKKVLVATGSGIAPYRAMLLDYLTHGGTDEIMLYWGLRYEVDIFWQKEFVAMAATYPNFHFLLCLSQGSETWQGPRGHVEAYIFAQEKNLTDIDWYLCGNKGMINEMRDKLKEVGVPQNQVKFELFF